MTIEQTLSNSDLSFAGGRFTRDSAAGMAGAPLVRPVEIPLSRKDVPDNLLPSPRKPEINTEYGEVSPAWPDRRRPIEARLQLELVRQGDRVLAAARDAVDAHNRVNGALGASVAALEQAKLPVPWDDVESAWCAAAHIAVLRPTTPLFGGLHPNKKKVARLVRALVRPLGDEYGPLAGAIDGAVRRALADRDDALTEGKQALAAEIVAGAFWRAWEQGGADAKRPRFADFFCWPWTEKSQDRALLGLLAMKAFQNDSGDESRWFAAGWADRDPLRFVHASRPEQRAAGAGPFVLKTDFDEPATPVTEVLERVRWAWGLYTGRRKATPGTMRGLLTEYAGTNAAKGLLDGLCAREVNAGLYDVDDGEGVTSRPAVVTVRRLRRYKTPPKRERSLSAFLPLLAAVAADYEARV